MRTLTNLLHRQKYWIDLVVSTIVNYLDICMIEIDSSPVHLDAGTKLSDVGGASCDMRVISSAGVAESEAEHERAVFPVQ